eukprot:1060852-Pyramimonas_sp.AAC.1
MGWALHLKGEPNVQSRIVQATEMDPPWAAHSWYSSRVSVATRAGDPLTAVSQNATCSAVHLSMSVPRSSVHER